MQHQAPRIDDRTVGQIAAKADCDNRTVIRKLAGLPVRGRVGVRVDCAIAEVLGAPASGNKG
jgi:hypothetical protein